MSIDDLKAKLKKGGARANLFRCSVTFPANAQGDTELSSFMIKAAQLPGSTLGLLEIPFRGGQKLKLAGDRVFEPMTITVINDAEFKIRNAFERWQNNISAHSDATGDGSPLAYQTDVTIEQLDRDDTVLKKYVLRGAWPSNVSPIEVGFENVDTVEEYTVELQFQYWDADGVTS